MVLKEFNFVAIYNMDIIIWYFWDSLCLSFQAQLDERRRKLDKYDKAIKKIINTKTKVNQKLLSNIWEIYA